MQPKRNKGYSGLKWEQVYQFLEILKVVNLENPRKSMQLELFHEFGNFSEYKFSSMPEHLQLLSREWNLEDSINSKNSEAQK